MNGTSVSVISDPKISEGIRWLMVRTDEGQEGWVFEEGIIDPADYHPVSDAVNNSQISYSNAAGSANSSNNGYYDSSLGSANSSNNVYYGSSSGYSNSSNNGYYGSSSGYSNSSNNEYKGSSNYSTNWDNSYDNAYSDSVMVWRYPSGKKYHSHKGCGNSGNDWQITLDEALRLGLEPCKKCY